MNARPIPNRQLCCYEMFTTRLLSAASCAPGGDLLLALSILFRVRPTARLLYLSPPLRARIASTTLLRHASSSPSKSDACSIPFVRSRRPVGKANLEGRKEEIGWEKGRGGIAKALRKEQKAPRRISRGGITSTVGSEKQS